MKRLLSFFIYLVLFINVSFFFFPKVNLYYLAEQYMKEQNLFISNEKATDTGFSLVLEHADLFFDKLALAKVENITLSPWVFYNTLEFRDIELDDGFSDFLPPFIQRVQVSHLLFNPMKVKLSGDADAGFFNGEVDILNRHLKVILQVNAKAEKRYKNMLRRLQKTEEGYVYEYKF
jgi:hypothetical protein